MKVTINDPVTGPRTIEAKYVSVDDITKPGGISVGNFFFPYWVLGGAGLVVTALTLGAFTRRR